MSPHLKDVETETRSREMALPCGELSGRVERRVSRLPQELRGAYAVPRVPTPGLPSPGKPISRDFRRAPPQTTNHSQTPHVAPTLGPGGGPSLNRGWEIGKKAGPSGNSRPRLPEPRAQAGTSRRRPGAGGSRVTSARPWGAGVGRRARGGRASSGQGARAGSGRSGSRSFLGISRYFSITASPTTAVPEPRSRPPTHSQFLNQHHLPGTPSQLPPLPPLPPPPPPPPPPLPPLTAPARPRLPALRAPTAPARPHPSAATRRVSAREGLAPPQFRAPPWAHEVFRAAARLSRARTAATAPARTRTPS